MGAHKLQNHARKLENECEVIEKEKEKEKENDSEKKRNTTLESHVTKKCSKINSLQQDIKNTNHSYSTNSNRKEKKEYYVLSS